MHCCRHLLFGLLLAAFAAPFAAADELLVFFGTYTGGDSKGIYVSRLDLENGHLTKPELAGEIKNPSFVAIHPNGKNLYAVGELPTFQGKQSGSVSAFSIDAKTGKLTPLNQQASGGGGPCHLVVDQSGKNVLVANYGGGSVACLPIEKDGKLAEASSFVQHEGQGADPRRQKGPHAHSINVDAANRFAFAADLGLDKVLIYRLDADQGKLTPNDPAFVKTPPGGGPRHFAFHPGGKFAYTNNEMTSSVTALAYDADRGDLKPVQTISTLPEPVKGNSTAETQVHPSGKFVYVSNRGHDSIAVFKVDEKTGKLTVVEYEKTGGKTPRNFCVDPTGKYVLAANQNSGNVVVFRIDQKTGELEATGQEVAVPNAVCVKFLSVGS